MPLIPLYLVEENINPRPICTRANKPEVTGPMILEAATLPFRPDRSKYFRKADSLLNLDIDDIRHRCGFNAMLLNLFGPVLTEYRGEPDPALVAKLREIHQKLLLCLIPENGSPLPKSIAALGIPVAYGFTPQSDARCYTAISNIHIQTRHNKTHSIEPERHLVVGSNFLTDVKCREAGMKYLHVKPKPGIESGFYRLLRNYGEKVADLHHYLRLLRQKNLGGAAETAEKSPLPLLTEGNGRHIKKEL